MTQLYLVRHAIAEPRGSSWPDDSLRPLSEEGRRRFAAAAAGLAQFEGVPDRVLTSPYVRARQTAELLAAAGGPGVAVESFAWLEPVGSAAVPLAGLRKHARAARVAVVGHEPDLSIMAAALLGAARPVPFKKGAICRIDVTWGRATAGTLVWFLPPAVLRGLGR